MFNNNDINMMHLRVKSFWTNFDKIGLLNSLNDLAKNGSNSKNEKSFSYLYRFLSNIENPSTLINEYEQIFSENKDLKQNDAKYKKQIDELKARNDVLTAEIQRANKIISSYQCIQISTLKEVEELKINLELIKAGTNSTTTTINNNNNNNTTNNSNMLSHVEIEATSMVVSEPCTVQTSSLMKAPSATTTKPIINNSKKKKNFSLSSSSSISSAKIRRFSLSTNQPENKLPKTTVKPPVITKLNLIAKRSYKPRNKEPSKKLTVDYDVSSIKVKCIDTAKLLSDVRSRLVFGNLSLSLFAKAMFNASEYLFYNPKSWKNSDEKHRNNYIKMYLWLNDPHGVQKLLDFKQGNYDPNKYRNIKCLENRRSSLLVSKNNKKNSTTDCILISDDDTDNDTRIKTTPLPTQACVADSTTVCFKFESSAVTDGRS